MKIAAREKIHFVTGKLAEPAVRAVVNKLAGEIGFDYSIQVMPITVAALITSKWCLRHLQVPEGTTRVIVPDIWPTESRQFKPKRPAGSNVAHAIFASCPVTSARRIRGAKTTAIIRSKYWPRSISLRDCRLKRWSNKLDAWLPTEPILSTSVAIRGRDGITWPMPYGDFATREFAARSTRSTLGSRTRDASRSRTGPIRQPTQSRSRR